MIIKELIIFWQYIFPFGENCDIFNADAIIRRGMDSLQKQEKPLRWNNEDKRKDKTEVSNMLVSATEMIKKAHEGHYTVGAFNIKNMKIIKTILESRK